MEKQVEEGLWLRVEADGTYFIPAEFVGLPFELGVGERVDELSLIEAFDQAGEEMWDDAAHMLADYVPVREDRISEIGLVHGWGARLSMPGYLDCTEWAVCESEEEAFTYLEEIYGD